MARLALASVSCSRTGVDITPGTLAVTTGFTGVSFNADGQSVLLINNGSGSPLALTENIVKQVESVTPAGNAVSVPAGKMYAVGPLSKGDYGDSTGKCSIDFAGAATITVGLIVVPYVP